MNKRIYELAEQAGAYCEDYKPPYLSNMSLEKFAELLLQECINEIHKRRGGDATSVHADKINDIVKHLNRHFYETENSSTNCPDLRVGDMVYFDRDDRPDGIWKVVRICNEELELRNAQGVWGCALMSEVKKHLGENA